MTFVEFLEAIVRIADKTEIPHCLIVSTTFTITSLMLISLLNLLAGRI